MMDPWRDGESDRQINRVRERETEIETQRKRDREMSEREVRVTHTEKENGKKLTIMVSLNLINDLLYKLKSKNSNCINFLSYDSIV